MCGRAAQTTKTRNVAARDLSLPANAVSTLSPSATSKYDSIGDNFNLSPGMDCVVMSANGRGEIQTDWKKWGIVSKNGTTKKPLYRNEQDVIKLCFESLCYNARADTLYEKPTFSKLVRQGRTCIVAIDGYFEWKSQPIPRMNKKKQPYFVYRKLGGDQRPDTLQLEIKPLLIAGVWTRVATGISSEPELDTFAMITTEASKEIDWLHHRMPVCVGNIDLARRWLRQPSEALKNDLENAARANVNAFDWHKVTPEMSKLTFRSDLAIKEMKETTPSVKKFFVSDGYEVRAGRKEQIKSQSSSKADGKNNSVISLRSSLVEKKAKQLSQTNESSLSRICMYSTAVKGRKRQQTLPAAYFSPNKKVIINTNESKTSTRTSTTSKSANKQASINLFFQTKKKKGR